MCGKFVAYIASSTHTKKVDNLCQYLNIKIYIVFSKSLDKEKSSMSFETVILNIMQSTDLLCLMRCSRRIRMCYLRIIYRTDVAGIYL